MRSLDYLQIAWKDISRQQVRSGLTIIALTISTVILLTISAICIGGQKAVVDQLSPDNSLSNIVVTPNQNTGAGSLFGSVQEVNAKTDKLNDASVQQLAKIQNVDYAVPRAHIWEFASFKVAGSNKQFVAQAEGVPGYNDVPLIAGSNFTPQDNRHVVIIGAAYVKELGYTDPNVLVGKIIHITSQKGYRGDGATIPEPTATAQAQDTYNQTTTTLDATIVGVTKTGSTQNSLFTPLNWARQIRAINYYDGPTLKTTDQVDKDGYTTIVVKAKNVDNVKTVSAAITAAGYSQISTLSQVEKLQQFSTTMWVILGSVAIIVIIAAALGVVNTMLMVVSEQRYTISVWRAVGATKVFITKQYLYEATLLGFAGGVIGASIGLGVVQVVNQYVNVLLRAQGLAVSNIALAPLWLIVGAVVLTTLFAMIAGIYPAYRAVRRSNPSRDLNSGQ